MCRRDVACLVALVALLTLCSFVGSARADLWYWDTSADAGLQGGSGVWDSTTVNWNVSADGLGSRYAWQNYSGAYAAEFTTGSGTVTGAAVGSTSVSNITFDAGTNYCLNFIATNGLNLTGTPAGTITTNADATINAYRFALFDQATITKNGTATLTLKSTSVTQNFTSGLVKVVINQGKVVLDPTVFSALPKRSWATPVASLVMAPLPPAARWTCTGGWAITVTVLTRWCFIIYLSAASAPMAKALSGVPAALARARTLLLHL